MFFGLLVAVAMYVVVVPQSVVLADDGLPPPRIYSETELVNGAEYIFVGRRDEIFCCGISSNATLASVEMASLDCAGPCVEYSTLHSVSVLDVIRGELVTGQAVSVEQQGGTMDGDKQFYVGDGPMVIGKEYLFLTNYIYGLQPSGVFSILGPGQGNIRLDDNPARDELVNHWRDVLGNLPCDVSDALVRDGVTYGRMRWNAERRFVPRGLIGAEIARTGSINSLANPCRGELPDLGASLLESGSAIHAIQGYEPGFRVAAFDGESYALYQVIWNSTAAVAEDIYDIRGRVALIGATQYSSCVDFWTCEF